MSKELTWIKISLRSMINFWKSKRKGKLSLLKIKKANSGILDKRS